MTASPPPPPHQTPPAAHFLPVTVAGEVLCLSSLRGIYWPRQDVILLSDAHLGKADSFRVLGAPLPASEILRNQLDCLRLLCDQFDCKRLLVLGDLLHAPAGQTKELVSGVKDWITQHNIRLELVPGNHDRKIAAVADEWRISLHPQTFEIDPFCLVHEPCEVPGRYVLCGHIHPSVLLRNGHDSIKLPAFHLGTNIGILPAFSRFTGGVPVAPIKGDRVYAIADNKVLQIH